MVHFFLYDYKFERVWKQPDLEIEKLSRYRAVLSPDFSMYLEMNPTMQLYKYMSYQRKLESEDLECYKIGGAKVADYDIIDPYRIGKGGGSAYGGEWRPSPNKPGDQRFLGNPGQINQSGYSKTNIGNDGKADYERHETSHSNSKAHTNPHDHRIDWSKGFPDLGKPINYPNGAPPFDEIYGGELKMYEQVIPQNTPEQNRFTSISDFKWCMKCGGEVQFIWRGTTYCCFGKLTPPGKSEIMRYISKADSEVGHEFSEKWCTNTDEVLEYMVGEDRLRDVITQVTVIERTI